MTAELQRNQKTLQIDDFEVPYFIGYRIIEQRKVDARATFGALIREQDVRQRRAAVDVRVGDYRFDSSPDPDLAMGYDYESFAPSNEVPIDGDFSSIQSTLWLLTDAAYKQGLSSYLQKKAKAVSTIKKQHVDSFSREEAVRMTTQPLKPKADLPAWRQMVKQLSKRFRDTPALLDGTVSFGLVHTKTFLVTTEGTRVAKEHALYQLNVHAVTRAEDGMLLDQGKTVYFDRFDAISPMAEMEKIIQSVSTDLIALRDAPLAEPYTGPAILDGEAAGVFFHETIGHRLEGERQNDDSEGQTFKGQVGKAILPRFISIVDDPTVDKLGDVALNGHYRIDDQGVVAKRTVLIERGVLKSFLTSRTPIEGFNRSNGHGRAQGTARPVARMGNLLVSSDKAVAREELKAMLVAEAKKQGKPYGLIISDMTGGSTNTSNYGYQAFKGTPRKVYRVDAETGEEVLVRGVEMVGTPLTAINKIIATDSTARSFNGYCGAESGYVPVSASAPAILFREVELQRTKRAKRRGPILKAPWAK